MFLRSLPIPAEAVVGGRMLAMLLALLVSAPAFFATFYLLSRGTAGAPDDRAFVPFALVWVGYALVYGGGLVYLWIARSKRAELAATLALPLTLLLVAVATNLLTGVGIVERTISLAQEHGILAGPVCLMVGLAAFALWGRATAKGLKRRDLGL